MFVIILQFSENKAQASHFMAGHNQWIKKGFEDNIFLLVGSLQEGLGGSVIANGESKKAIENRVRQDPFVIENVVTAEIFEIDPKKADERLEFLLANSENDL